MPCKIKLLAATAAVGLFASLPQAGAEFVYRGTAEVIEDDGKQPDGVSAPMSAAGTAAPWFSIFGGPTDDYVYDTKAKGGFLYSVGNIDSGGGNGDILLTKADSAGNVVWSRVLGTPARDGAAKLEIGTDGSIYIAGHIELATANGYDILLLKCDGNGNVVWSKSYGSTYRDFASDLDLAADGSIYVSGSVGTDAFNGADAVLAKFSPSGALVWRKVYGGNGEDRGEAVVAASDGSVYVAGNLQAGTVFRGYLVKYNASGGEQWSRGFGGSANVFSFGVATGTDGAVYTVGRTHVADPNGDGMVAKLLPNGTYQWGRRIGTSEEDDLKSVMASPNGGIVIGGHAGFYSNPAMIIASFQSDGILAAARNVTLPDTFNYLTSVMLDGDAIVGSMQSYSTTTWLRDAMVARVPLDLSGSGTYGPFTYGSQALSIAAENSLVTLPSRTNPANALTFALGTPTNVASAAAPGIAWTRYP